MRARTGQIIGAPVSARARAASTDAPPRPSFELATAGHATPFRAAVSQAL
jgi:hypothetical protein